MADSPSPDELASLRATVQRLEREQAFSHTILETVPAIVMRVSVDGVIEFINRVLPEYAPTPIGQSIYHFIPEEQREGAQRALALTSSTLKPSTYEVFARASDGTRDWYVTHVGPILEGGRLAGLTLVCINASQARRTEQALVESRARLKLALDAGNVGVWRWDRQRDVVEWDEKLATMFGVPPERSPRTVAEFLALIPEEQRAPLGAHIERALETGVYPDYELALEDRRWFIIKGGVLRGAAGEIVGLLGGVVDVTERRRIEEHLREAQKLEAVGQLSAGVAHNFNNMLAVILPALEVARLSASGPEAGLMDDALTSASNAAELVRQLMVFSRTRPRTVARHEPLADVVRRAGELSRQTFERRVQLELGDLETARFASVEAGATEQAVMNLLLNARDALGSDPLRPARIEVSARRLDEREVSRRHLGAQGPYVELRVADTGCGMDAATRRRMLEPFFTTKPTGRGTGLGLATVWATVQAQRGFLECESEVGQGTTFSLFFPAQEEPVPFSTATPAPALDVGAGRVVLLVEDELAVARATATLLASAGFVVLSAASGDEALQLAEGRPVDVVLLDYSMPGRSAEDTMAGLRRQRPGLPVVCLSGLGVTLEGATSQLVKPASRAELVTALAEALTSH